MQKIKFLIVTCDKTRKILPAFNHQFDKYVGNDLFEREFIDLKSEPVETWTQNIYNKIKDIKDEFVAFSLDDYLIIDQFKKEIFDEVMLFMERSKNIGRYELGYGVSEKRDIDTLHGVGHFDVMQYKQDTPYRVSCQISIWRTEYLFKFLKEKWSPWQFEVEGSKMSNNDKWDVVGTNRDWALRWIEESALSGRHPKRVNVMGLRLKDLFELIQLGYIDKNTIQFGMAKGIHYNNSLDILNLGKKYKKFYV